MISQSSRVICRRDKSAAERVHLCKRSNLTRIAIIVCVHTSCKRRTRSRLYCYESRLCLTFESVFHKRSDKSAEVGTAARTTYDYVGIFVEHLHCFFTLKTYYGLMQKHLIEYAAEYVSAVGSGHSLFDSFGYSASERTRRVGFVLQNLSAYVGSVGRAGDYVTVENLHNSLSERFLLIRTFYHKYVKSESEVRTSFRQSSTPLPCTRFGSYRSQALSLCVICLSKRGVKLVTSRGIVALEFVVNLSGRAQRFFQIVCPAKRRRSVKFVHLHYRLGDIDISGRRIHLLMCKLFAENRIQILFLYRLQRNRIEKCVGLRFHICAEVVPLFGQLLLGQIKSVRYFCHFSILLLKNFFCFYFIKKILSP